MIRSTFTFLITSIIAVTNLQGQVSEMSWELDYEVYLKLANDSSFAYDIREAFHVKNTGEDIVSDFVFYPVNPGVEYIDGLNSRQQDETSYKTLWSALNAKLGGGWVHFINCIAYSLEMNQLDLKAPLMKRPESDWKPDPITDSYKRTKKWEYYVPLNQKVAIKEYKTRQAQGELGDLKSIPPNYIDLFLQTSQGKYEKMANEKLYNDLAKIDLIKVIMGANYLGEAQITYISNSVLNAVKTYSVNRLPSVVIFDEFDAAAVMSLDADGYKIESIAIKGAGNLEQVEIDKRTEQIEAIIAKINAYNNDSFKKRLGNYYGN